MSDNQTNPREEESNERIEIDAKLSLDPKDFAFIHKPQPLPGNQELLNLIPSISYTHLQIYLKRQTFSIFEIACLFHLKDPSIKDKNLRGAIAEDFFLLVRDYLGWKYNPETGEDEIILTIPPSALSPGTELEKEITVPDLSGLSSMDWRCKFSRPAWELFIFRIFGKDIFRDLEKYLTNSKPQEEIYKVSVENQNLKDQLDKISELLSPVHFEDQRKNPGLRLILEVAKQVETEGIRENSADFGKVQSRNFTDCRLKEIIRGKAKALGINFNETLAIAIYQLLKAKN